MVIIDSIVDVLTRVRNALRAHHETMEIPANKEEVEIAKVLRNEGFIMDYTVDGDAKKTITVILKYDPNSEKVINGLKRVSKPGPRVHAKVDSIPCVINGLGVVIISTSHGVITDREAKAKHIGGEIIAYVW